MVSHGSINRFNGSDLCTLPLPQGKRGCPNYCIEKHWKNEKAGRRNERTIDPPPLTGEEEEVGEGFCVKGVSTDGFHEASAPINFMKKNMEQHQPLK